MEKTVFAGYRLLEQIGSGGVGTVYKAMAPDGEIRALKIFNGEASNSAEIVHQFQREFQISQKVQHPNIVRYLDIGMEDGRPFLVMEHLPGISLWHRVRKTGPINVTDVLGYIEQIASALNAGHVMRIVHRDVTPNNVMLTAEKNAKLMDFGLVKDLESKLDLTGDQVILGTPFFMSPEQFFDRKEVDHRSDVYALACCAYYALTANVPFKFRGAGLLEKKLHGQFRDPKESFPETFAAIFEVLEKALEPEPNRRPQSAVDLAQMLRQAAKPAELALHCSNARNIERRSTYRSKCEFDGHCLSSASKTTYASKITDISTEGLCLLTETQFPVKKKLELTFHFTEDGERWDYKVRVIYVRNLAANRWCHGCRFIEPIEEPELKALLNESADKVWMHVCDQADDISPPPPQMNSTINNVASATAHR